MNSENKKNDFRMLVFIGGPKIAKQAQGLLADAQIPVQYHVIATGTASGEVIHLLGLDSIEKEVIITTLTKKLADEMLIKMTHQLYLGTPDSGVAFTVQLSGGSASILKLLQTLDDEKEIEKDGEIMENKYTMIMAFVDQGYSEEVMAAARPAGARGGTVFHSRHVGSQEAEHHWGIAVQEEREIVLIVAERDKKLEIMKAISESCGLQTEAHGFVISVPVDSVAGLYKGE